MLVKGLSVTISLTQFYNRLLIDLDYEHCLLRYLQCHSLVIQALVRVVPIEQHIDVRTTLLLTTLPLMVYHLL